MTRSPSAPGAHLANRLGLADRVFAGPVSRRLQKTVEDGLAKVEAHLADELHVADALADATSRYLYEAGGKRVRPIALPRWLLSLAARGDRLIRGKRAKLTSDRVAYFCHPDWVSAKRPPETLWKAELPGLVGLKATAEAYRKEGWL